MTPGKRVMARWQKVLCWFGIHDPVVKEFAGEYLTIKYRIYCRHCGREAGGR